MQSKSIYPMWPSYLFYSIGLILGLGNLVISVLGFYTIARYKNEPVITQVEPIHLLDEPVAVQAKLIPPSQQEAKHVEALVMPTQPKTESDRPSGENKQQANIESSWQKADALLNQRNAVIDRYLVLTKKLTQKGVNQTSRSKISLELEQIIKELDRANALYKVASQDFGTASTPVSPQPVNNPAERVATNNPAITPVPPQPATLETRTRPLNVRLRTGKTRLRRFIRHRKARPMRPGHARLGQIRSKA